MANTFLGKSVPTHKGLPSPHKKRVPWILFLLGPAVTVSATAYLLFMHTQSDIRVSVAIPAPTTTVRLLADTPLGTNATKTKDDTTTLKTTSKATLSQSPCTGYNDNNSEVNTIFPLLPSAATCPASSWNLYVFIVMCYKALGLLNWIAGALAIILTMYAGLLYLTGFAKEANAKTAKQLVITTYVGLFIVMGSRLILYSTIATVSGSTDSTSFQGAYDTITK